MMNAYLTKKLGHSMPLLNALREHAKNRPQDIAYHQISATGEIETVLTYQDLQTHANAIASSLQEICQPGDRVILLLLHGSDFLLGFLACLIAGLIAVPAYPVREPSSATRSVRNFDRLISILKDATPAVALSNQSMLDRRAELTQASSAFATLQWLAIEQATAAKPPALPVATPGDIAFLQYTSGSTATPKGVMVSHANLLALFADMDASCRHERSSVMVTWIPVYHDMGLIYGLLLPLYFGFPIYSLLPAAVLQQPVRWLQAMSRFRGSHSAAPNFAFELCVQRVSQAAKASLDLSAWQVCVNGAETVRPQTLQRFAEAFSCSGVRPDVIRPGYGLAECTLKVTCVAVGQAAKYIRLDADACERSRVVQLTAGADSPTARTFQSCGWTHIDADIRIVDPSTGQECDGDVIGEIWVRSASVTQGYWNQPEASAATMQARLATGQGPFLRTGDLGFIVDRELYVAGRLKDLIIIRGRNLYPQDIEATVEAAHPAVRLGRCCAFAVELDDGEGLVLVAEVERIERHGFNAEEAFAKIQEAIAQQHQVQLHDAVFVRTATFPLTSSGKVQRQAARQEYHAGTLEVIARMRAESRTASAMPTDQHHARYIALQKWLTDFISARLRIPPEKVAGKRSFTALGLDSLALLEMTGALEEQLARTLPDTIVLTYPDIDQLSRFLAEQTS